MCRFLPAVIGFAEQLCLIYILCRYFSLGLESSSVFLELRVQPLVLYLHDKYLVQSLVHLFILSASREDKLQKELS